MPHLSGNMQVNSPRETDGEDFIGVMQHQFKVQETSLQVAIEALALRNEVAVAGLTRQQEQLEAELRTALELLRCQPCTTPATPGADAGPCRVSFGPPPEPPPEPDGVRESLHSFPRGHSMPSSRSGSRVSRLFTRARNDTLFGSEYAHGEQSPQQKERAYASIGRLNSWRSEWITSLGATNIFNVIQRKSASSDSNEMPHWLARIVQSENFDLFCGLMILINAVLIGAETEYLTQHQQVSNELRHSQAALNVWYIVEICLRLATQRCLFFYGNDSRWNLFDAFLVTTSLLDLVAESAIATNMNGTRVIRAIRLMRITRTLRVIRVLRYLAEFRRMVYAMSASLQTLFWSLVLLLFLMYTFSIWLTQGVTSHTMMLDPAERAQSAQLVIDLEGYFGTLGRSLYTLYKAITAGMSWGDAAEALLQISPFYTAIFIGFLSISLFGALNIVTSVFVESAMSSAQHSRELLVQEKTKQKETYVKHLKHIFKEIDQDKSGVLSEEELVDFLSNDNLHLQSYFEALELNATNARVLFRLLDQDGSGCVDYVEFCEGCMKLKGEAQSFDINCLMYESRRMHKWMTQFMTHVEDQLRVLVAATQPRRGSQDPRQPLTQHDLHKREDGCEHSKPTNLAGWADGTSDLQTPPSHESAL